MAVRRVGRLRGAVNAAADAMRIAAGLSISKIMSRANVNAKARQLHHRFGLCPAKLCELIVRVQSDRSQASGGRGLRANGCEKTSASKTLGEARAAPRWPTQHRDALDLVAANFALDPASYESCLLYTSPSPRD